jgi:hypothetical protein
MEDKFVFLWTLSPAVDIVGGVKTPKAYYFNGRTFLNNKRAFGMSVRCIQSKGTKGDFHSHHSH